jgi:hypothetical protein
MEAKMASRSGVGFTEKSDSREAGIEAAKSAMDQLGKTEVDLVWIYQTAKHDPVKFRDGVTSVVGMKCQVVGGYAAGIMARGKLGYDGYQAGVAAFKFDQTKYSMFLEKDLRERGEHKVGEALAKQVMGQKYEGDMGLIYMYDTVKSFSQSGFSMNIGTYIVEGMEKELKTWPSAAGFGMIGNMQFNPTKQFYNDQILEQTAIALAFHGKGFRLDTTVFHGCKPASDYHVITKADKNVVLEIDGKPALTRIAEILGPDSATGWEQYPLFITLGVNKGDKYGDFKEEDYANRLCMAIDRERQGLIMFEPDLTEGTEVQLMRRSIDFSYIRRRAEELMAKLGNRKPFFSLYIDCAGRAGVYCGSKEEEGAEVQRVIEPKMPMLGMFTGVEIGKIGSTPQQALDWSGVLCVWSEEG